MINYDKFSLNVKLTDKCNLRCKYCPNAHGDSIISKNIIDKAIQWYDLHKSKLGNFYFEFSGGECTEVMDILEYGFSVVPQDVIIKMITNGTNTKNKRVQKLLSENDKRLMLILSADGNKEWHDFNRKDGHGIGSFDRIDFDFLFSQKFKSFSVSSVATLNNVESLYDRIKYLYDIGFREFGVSVDHTRLWTNEQLWMYERELCKLAGLLVQCPDIQNLVPLAVIHSFKQGKMLPCLCNKGYSEFTVIMDGTVTPCKGISDIFGRMLPWDIRMGNIDKFDEEDFGFSWNVIGDSGQDYTGCDLCLAKYRCGCVPVRYIRKNLHIEGVESLFSCICKLNNIEDKVYMCNDNM